MRIRAIASVRRPGAGSLRGPGPAPRRPGPKVGGLVTCADACMREPRPGPGHWALPCRKGPFAGALPWQAGRDPRQVRASFTASFKLGYLPASEKRGPRASPFNAASYTIAALCLLA